MILPHVKDMNFAKFCRDLWPMALDNEYLWSENQELKEIPTAPKEVWDALKKQMATDKENYSRILQRHNIKKGSE